MRTGALISGLLQEDASHIGKIGDDNLRMVFADFLNVFTASIASPHHELTIYTHSPPHPGAAGAAINMLQVRPRASSNTLSACITTYSVGREPLVWCVNCLGCVARSRFLRVRSPEETSGSDSTF